jgi:cobalt-zinc-cadmium efflux system outer membrane protein
MNRHFVFIRLVGVLAFFSGPAAAQQLLTLGQAQAEARARAPESAELEAAVRGAEALVAQARRKFRQDPTVSAGYFNGALIGRDETAANVDVSVPVDISGSWKPRTASAEADVRRVGFDRDAGLLALDEQVAIAFAEVALQQRRIAREERLASLYAIASDAAHRQLDVGQAAQFDVDSADIDLAGARLSLAQARGELAQARSRLERLLGRPASEDIVVSDPVEATTTPLRPDLDALVERDPRVQAARAEIDAATFERQTFERLVKPIPTFGLASAYNRRDIPVGSFSGAPFANSLMSNWSEPEILFNVSLPIPLFDRQLEPRARATGRLVAAEARAQRVRADVRAELESAWVALESAAGALQGVGDTSLLIDRDAGFIDQAVRAGQFDAVTRSFALRRLEEAALRVDTAVRDYRVARAAWVRRSFGSVAP